jgi:hypothetical protein
MTKIVEAVRGRYQPDRVTPAGVTGNGIACAAW